MEEKFNSIGLLGGTFDPPHQGHLKISELALKSLPIDKIYWIITKRNPLKKKTYFSIKKRSAKCRIILKKKRKIKLMYLDSLIKSSRFYDIIKYFKKKREKTLFFLIIGSDNLIKFHLWKKYEKILENCILVVFSRKGYDKMAKKSKIMKKNKKFNIIFFQNKKINISSTILRRKLTS